MHNLKQAQIYFFIPTKAPSNSWDNLFIPSMYKVYWVPILRGTTFTHEP